MIQEQRTYLQNKREASKTEIALITEIGVKLGRHVWKGPKVNIDFWCSNFSGAPQVCQKKNLKYQ